MHVMTGRIVRRFAAHTKQITSISRSEDQSLLLTTSQDGTAVVWDLDLSDVLQVYEHANAVTHAAVFRDRSRAVTASNDCRLQVWMHGQLQFSLASHRHAVTRVLISRCQQQIQSALQDNSLKVWAAADGQLLDTLKGHTAPVLKMYLSRTGRYLLSESIDFVLKVWDLQDGFQCVKSLAVPRNDVASDANRGHNSPQQSSQNDFDLNQVYDTRVNSFDYSRISDEKLDLDLFDDQNTDIDF